MWTDLPADNSTDWSNRAFLQQFIDAINERRGAFGQSPLASVTVGQDVSADSFIANLQDRAVDIARLFLPPDYEFDLPNDGHEQNGTTKIFWLPHMETWEIYEAAGLTEMGFRRLSTNAPDVFTFGRPGWRAYSRTGSTIYDYSDGPSGWQWYVSADQVTPPDVVHVGFTRKYPREIAATTDPGSAGQRARLLTSAKIYEHDGSAWTLAADQTTDPDVITAAGFCEAGDYIGPWIWNELQAVINLCKQTMFWANVAPARMSFTFPFSLVGGLALENATWAGAKAAAEADWPNTPENDSISRGGINPNGTYQAALGRSTARFAVTPVPTISNVQFWIKINTIHGSPNNMVFDSFELGIAENTWAKVSDGTNLVHLVGDLDVMPTWCDEPTGGVSQQRGYLYPFDTQIKGTALSAGLQFYACGIVEHTFNFA